MLIIVDNILEKKKFLKYSLKDWITFFNQLSLKWMIIIVFLLNVVLDLIVQRNYIVFFFSIIYVIQRKCEEEHQDYKDIVEKIENYTIVDVTGHRLSVVIKKKVNNYHISKYGFLVEKVINNNRVDKHGYLYFDHFHEIHLKVNEFLTGTSSTFKDAKEMKKEKEEVSSESSETEDSIEND